MKAGSRMDDGRNARCEYSYSSHCTVSHNVEDEESALGRQWRMDDAGSTQSTELPASGASAPERHRKIIHVDMDAFSPPSSSAIILNFAASPSRLVAHGSGEWSQPR